MVVNLIVPENDEFSGLKWNGINHFSGLEKKIDTPPPV